MNLQSKIRTAQYAGSAVENRKNHDAKGFMARNRRIGKRRRREVISRTGVDIAKPIDRLRYTK